MIKKKCEGCKGLGFNEGHDLDDSRPEHYEDGDCQNCPVKITCEGCNGKGFKLFETFKLPKKHLSFSQIELWIKAPETYRKRYYAKDPPSYGQSQEMAFGNEVTEAMERNEDWCEFIPRYETFEQEMLFEIEGVNILAFIDNFDKDTITFREQKTGRTPWTQKKVDKHNQLVIYSLGLQKKFGKVTDECELIWVNTEKVFKTKMIGDIELESESYDLKLTGEYKVFKRIITQQERDDMEKLIIKVAREIEEDYKAQKHLYE